MIVSLIKVGDIVRVKDSFSLEEWRGIIGKVIGNDGPISVEIDITLTPLPAYWTDSCAKFESRSLDIVSTIPNSYTVGIDSCIKKCECGSKFGGGTHSYWCDLFEVSHEH